MTEGPLSIYQHALNEAKAVVDNPNSSDALIADANAKVDAAGQIYMDTNNPTSS